MGKQHTASNGKPNFVSHQKATGEKAAKPKAPNGKRFKALKKDSNATNTPRGPDLQVHPHYCGCVTCKIKKGDAENARRINGSYFRNRSW